MEKYVETLSKKEFEKRCETEVELIKMDKGDKENLVAYLEEYFEDEELEELSEADTFAITGWDNVGWGCSVCDDPSYGVFLAKGNEIFSTESCIWVIRSAADKKKLVKLMARGEFIR